MDDTITNRIQVEKKTWYARRIIIIVAYRDITSEKVSDIDECEENYCWYDKQVASRGATYLNYQCRNGEDEIGVYVVYEIRRGINILPRQGNATYYQTWERSHKLPVSC